MTSAPTDLLMLRSRLQVVTGLGAISLGIVGDGAHQHTGGYHEGMDVLVAIGKYHGPPTSHVGSSTEDYSARLLRDRLGLTNDASAVDVGDDWPHGGRPAWLRFNNLLAQKLPADGALAAVRGINYSPDGEVKKRMDRQTGWAVTASIDTVTTHTHIEFFRDTEGNRAPTLDRIVQLAQEAISGQEDDMEQTDKLIRDTGFAGRVVGDTFADLQNMRGFFYSAPGAAGLTNPPPAGSVADLLARMVSAPAAGITQDMLNTAVKLALSDPSVTSALVQQINDDAAQRMAS